jgi:hypothetical protein
MITYPAPAPFTTPEHNHPPDADHPAGIYGCHACALVTLARHASAVMALAERDGTDGTG